MVVIIYTNRLVTEAGMLDYTKRINSLVCNMYNRGEKREREHPLVLALGTTYTARVSRAGLCSDQESMIFLLLSSTWMVTVIN